MKDVKKIQFNGETGIVIVNVVQVQQNNYC